MVQTYRQAAPYKMHSGSVTPAHSVVTGGIFADVVMTAQSRIAPGEMHVVKESQRRVEVKQGLDAKKGLSKRQRAPRKKATAAAVPPPAPMKDQNAPEELVADHELEILLDSFEADTFHATASAPSGPIEPSSHGEDPAATEELWRRLSNTAWLRNPESTPDDGNSSTVTHR